MGFSISTLLEVEDKVVDSDNPEQVVECDHLLRRDEERTRRQSFSNGVTEI